MYMYEVLNIFCLLTVDGEDTIEEEISGESSKSTAKTATSSAEQTTQGSMNATRTSQYLSIIISSLSL